MVAMQDMRAIEVERDGPVARITLNRPERLNGITAGMLRELETALARLAATDGLRCLILTGSGRGFCSGQDLDERRHVAEGASIDLEASLAGGLNRVVTAIRDLPFPTVACVNGVAAGAGLSLALACDIAIAVDDARLMLSFSNIGLGPDAGTSWFLPRAMGRPQALAGLMLGQSWTGMEAAEAGLVWKAVPAGRLAAETASLAQTLAARPTAALVAARRLVDRSSHCGLADQLAAEARSQGELSRTDDYREGLRAFLARRPPAFGGR
jgi:2-(1,2-epoxy-1,2-dihydrophenyl)acetyl-CoA isomerase